MKIAVAQIDCVPGNVPANVRKVGEFAHRAKAAMADWVIFPEMSDTGYSMPMIREQAASWSEGAVPELRVIARNLQIGIISGISERDASGIWNSQVVIDQVGDIVAKYRKTHLFAPAEEHKCFTAGDTLTVLPLADFRAGLSICYDLRFPELYRKLAVENDVNLLILSAAWPFPRNEHLRVLATARAIENQSYLALSNRMGTDGATTFCGESAILDPSGAILAAASRDREELLMAELSMEKVRKVRDNMPVFTHRRPELYARKCDDHVWR